MHTAMRVRPVPAEPALLGGSLPPRSGRQANLAARSMGLPVKCVAGVRQHILHRVARQPLQEGKAEVGGRGMSRRHYRVSSARRGWSPAHQAAVRGVWGRAAQFGCGAAQALPAEQPCQPGRPGHPAGGTRPCAPQASAALHSACLSSKCRSGCCLGCCSLAAPPGAAAPAPACRCLPPAPLRGAGSASARARRRRCAGRRPWPRPRGTPGRASAARRQV